MVDVIAKLTRRQSRALRVQVGELGIGGLNLASDGGSRRSYGGKGPVVDLHPRPCQELGGAGVRSRESHGAWESSLLSSFLPEALPVREGLRGDQLGEERQACSLLVGGN